MESPETKMLEELRTRLEGSPFVMLGLRGQAGLEEPMTAKFDEGCFPGSLYFFTHTDNRLVQGLGNAGPEAVATFASRGHELFATLRGNLVPCQDRALVDRFWSNGVAAWFELGQNDPTLKLLRFDVAHAEIWKTDVSVAGRFKLAFGGEVTRDDFQGEHVQAQL